MWWHTDAVERGSFTPSTSIILFAKLITILPRHVDEWGTILWKVGFIDDLCFNLSAAFDDRKDQITNLGEDLLVRPERVDNEMQQRLVFGRDPADAVTTAIGSTLLRSPASANLRQWSRNASPDPHTGYLNQRFHISREPHKL